MKQLEYTVRIITDNPVDPVTLADDIAAISGVRSAEVTNYRIKPTPREKKS